VLKEDLESSFPDTGASCQTAQPSHALRADPVLPFLEMAWSPSQMREFFNHRVLPPVWPGQKVTAVAIDGMTYKAGRQCEILYALQFADSTRGQSRWVAVTFAKKKKLREIYQRYYGGGGGASTRPTLCPAVFLPEYGCLIEFFPLDWQLPFLARALEPREVASLLFEGDPAAERPRGLPKVEVLRYRPYSRCVLRYVLDAPDGSDPQAVIGKVYQSRSQAAQDARVLNRLHPQAAACGLIIPKPLKVREEWGLLLMEQVPGTVVKLGVKQAQAPEQLKEVIELTATTLASFHCLRFESQKVRSLQTQLQRLHNIAALHHLVAPLFAQQVEALLEQIAQLGARSSAVTHTVVHRDFVPDQLLRNKDQMGVVDFDSVCLGDPAIDVGNFMARLHHKAVSKANNNFRQLAAYFLSEYQARLPEHRVGDRIHLFLSAFLVRRALRAFEVRPYDYGRAGANSLPVLLLQEAAACLKET